MTYSKQNQNPLSYRRKAGNGQTITVAGVCQHFLENCQSSRKRPYPAVIRQ